eukprot:GGOE01011188.1.p2 GENE.GGOE01011188.1~~GGOE01011188.1.p2  ORF type:complete len:180 (+),score=2.72 GGOE01011188.1:1047-1586(+)
MVPAKESRLQEIDTLDIALMGQKAECAMCQPARGRWGGGISEHGQAGGQLPRRRNGVDGREIGVHRGEGQLPPQRSPPSAVSPRPPPPPAGLQRHGLGEGGAEGTLGKRWSLPMGARHTYRQLICGHLTIAAAASSLGKSYINIHSARMYKGRGSAEQYAKPCSSKRSQDVFGQVRSAG